MTMAMEASSPSTYSYRNHSPEYSYHAYDEYEHDQEHDHEHDDTARNRVPSEVSDPDSDHERRDRRVKRRFLRLRSLFHDLNCACLSLPRLGKKSNASKRTTPPPPPPSSYLNTGANTITNKTSHSHSASVGYKGAHSWAMAFGLQEEGSRSGATTTTIAPTTNTNTDTNTARTGPNKRNIYKKFKNSKNSNHKETKNSSSLVLGGFGFNHENHELLRAYEDEIEFDYDFWEESERDVLFHADFTTTNTTEDDSNIFQNADNPFFTDAGKEMGFEVAVNSDGDDDHGGETWMQFNSPSMSFTPTKDVNASSKSNSFPKTPLGSYHNPASFPTSPSHGTPATVTDTSSTWDSEGDDHSTPQSKIGQLVMPSFEEEEDSGDGDDDGVDEKNVNRSDDDDGDSASISFDDKGSKSSSDMEGFSYSATSLGASTFQRGKQAALSPPWSPNLDLILKQDEGERIHAHGHVVIQDPPKTIRADVNDLFQTKESDDKATHVDTNKRNVNTGEADDQGTHDTDTQTSTTGLSNYMSIFYPEELGENASNLLNDSVSTIGEEGADDTDNDNVSASPSVELEEGTVPKDDFSYLFNASMSSI